MRIPLRSVLPARPFLAGVLAVAALSVTAARPVQAGDLAAFLERVERMVTLNEKVEAEVTIREADGTTRKAHLVVDPAGGGTAIFEQAEMGWKSETPLAWKDGKVVTKTGAVSGRIGIDDPLAGTDLRGIDFFPFWKTDYGRALTSDENTQEQTVSLYADKGRPYALYVVTFDKTRLVPRMIKFYRDTFSNLVRIRTDNNWVMVGSRPRPTEISIKDFTGNTLRTYTLDWKLAGAAAAAKAN